MLSLTIMGLVMVFIGIVLILLGFIILSRKSEVDEQDQKSYAVFLIGPFPILLKGGIKIAIISFVIVLFLVLIIFMSVVRVI